MLMKLCCLDGKTGTEEEGVGFIFADSWRGKEGTTMELSAEQGKLITLQSGPILYMCIYIYALKVHARWRWWFGFVIS